MGWCHEFGCQIVGGCDHPMQAGATACTCQECQVVCKGRFRSCSDVWARGPRPAHLIVRDPTLPPPPPAPAAGALAEQGDNGDREPSFSLFEVPPPSRPEVPDEEPVLVGVAPRLGTASVGGPPPPPPPPPPGGGSGWRSGGDSGPSGGGGPGRPPGGPYGPPPPSIHSEPRSRGGGPPSNWGDVVDAGDDGPSGHDPMAGSFGFGPPDPDPGAAPPGGSDLSWLRAEIDSLQQQIKDLSATVARQQSVFVDVAGARTAELHLSLTQMNTLAGDLRVETQRLRELQDAISHHLHDLVLDVVQPELRSQLSDRIPQLMLEAMGPELRRALLDWLPQVISNNIGPEVRTLLAEWLPVMVADAVHPEVRQAIAERLPDVTSAAVQPEVRRVLTEQLPEIVATTVSPHVRSLLSEWLPVMVADTVQPEVRRTIAELLPEATASAVNPELRRILAERLPALVADTVQPEVQRTLVERLPLLVAETVQPEVRRTLTERLPHLVSETVGPELRQSLDERLPSVVAQVVTPEIRRVLADRLPSLVAETVQPELRQILANRLPAVVAEVVTPEIGQLLIQRVPGMLAESVTPELSVSLAEMEGATAELRQEASKLRSLREVIAERLPESILGAIEPQLEELMAVRLPRIIGQLSEPVLRGVLTTELPQLVASAVQPDVRDQLAQRMPNIVADFIRPELRDVVAAALQDQLPSVIAEGLTPELREGLGAVLPSVVAEAVTPEVVMLVAARLPALVNDVVSPDLTASLADLEGCAAEMRAETARMRGLREVVAERLPDAVMAAVTTVLDETVLGQIPEAVSRLLESTVREAVATPLPAALGESLAPALESVLARQLPSLVEQTFEREVQLGLAESLPSLVASSTEPGVRAALAGLEGTITGIGDLRQQVFDRLEELTREATAAPAARLDSSAAALQTEAGRLAELRHEVVERLPGLLAEVVTGPLGEFESSASQLRAEVERFRTLREEVVERLPRLVEEVVSGPLGEFESSASQLRAEAERFRTLRKEVVEHLPQVVLDAVDAAVKGQPPSIPTSQIPDIVQRAVSASLAGIESTANQLRAETERLRTLGQDVPPGPSAPAITAEQVSGLVENAMAVTLADVEATSHHLRAEAEGLRTLGHEIARQLPGLVRDAVGATLAQMRSAPISAPPEAAHQLVAPPAQAAPPPASATATAPRAAPEPGALQPAMEPAIEPAPEPPAPLPAAESTSPVAPEPPTGPPGGPPAGPPAEDVPSEDIDPSLAAALAPAPAPANGARVVSEAAVEEAGSIACALPGVVVGPTLVRGISEAVSRSRLRRRRRRRAGPPAAGLHRRDPFATELTRRLEWFALARRQGTNGAATAGADDPGMIPLGERDGQEVAVPLGRTGGLCLVGPRAKEVARALVLTFLAENDTHAGRAIVVGDLFPAATVFPGLGRARDVGSVLGGLQAEASRRQSVFSQAGVSDVAGYRTVRPDDPLPLILVAAAEMTTLEAGRLGAILDQGAALGIVGVLVDAPLEGMLALRLQGPARVASVTPEGAVDTLLGARLFTVDREPAVELLDVLASARSEVEGEADSQPADEPFEGLPTSTPVINVRLLGNYRIEARGREIRAGLRGKAKELLAFYLLHPEGTTLEEATEALWPEADPRRGSEWFWTALGNLRSRLRSATENPDLKIIEREGDRYRIEPLFEVDLWRFESALAEAGSRSDDPSWPDLLQRASDLYGGELLSGQEWPWAEVPREDLRGRAVDVLVSLAATRLVGGNVAEALQALQRAVEIDPLAEQLYRRIMRLQAKLSRPEEADATFRALVSRLGEFDLQPSEESEKLHLELCGSG